MPGLPRDLIQELSQLTNPGLEQHGKMEFAKAVALRAKPVSGNWDVWLSLHSQLATDWPLLPAGKSREVTFDFWNFIKQFALKH